MYHDDAETTQNDRPDDLGDRLGVDLPLGTLALRDLGTGFGVGPGELALAAGGRAGAGGSGGSGGSGRSGGNDDDEGAR